MSEGRRLLSRAQVTKATVYGVMGAGWSVLAGPVTMILIARYFTPQLQGYYYTFSSILALNILVELGFSNIVKYFAGCEWARLSLDAGGRIVGDPEAYSRLISLGRVSFRWYLLIGAVVAVGIGTAGYTFFSTSPQAGVAWLAPWCALSVLSGVNMMLIPIWALLEGCGQVNHVYLFRTVGSVFGALATWACIATGLGLWTAPAAMAVTFTWSANAFVWRYRNFFRSFLKDVPGPTLDWSAEIWKVQWRIGISYFSAYFTYYVFTPILFRFHGPVLAGRFGMSLSIAGALSSVATMWSTPRGPQFAVMIAKREYEELDSLLLRIVVATSVVLLAGGATVWLIVYGLSATAHPFSARVLQPLPMALLVLGVIASTLPHPTLVYLRAHKQEPYVAISVTSAVLIGTLSLFLGKYYGALGVSGSYMVSHLLLLPWFVHIFLERRREWHSHSGDLARTPA